MASNSSFFSDKVIWLTGASSGIGRAVAIALSEYDCTLYLSARSRQNLESTRKACKPVAKVHILAGDLSIKADNQSICSSIKKQSGQLDLVLLNAGTCEYVDTDHFDSDLFQRLVDSNLMSTVFGTEAALPLLRQSKNAQLVAMSSTAAYLGIPRSEAYGATKAAIRNMFRALHVSLKPEGIHVAVVCPGFVATELTAKNTFAMPALITAELAAEHILHGINKGHHEIHFPKRLSWLLKFISILPDGLQFRLLANTLGT